MLLGFALIASLALTHVAHAAAAQSPTCDGRMATIVGTEDDDILTGTAGRDVIVGLGGNDIIRGLSGSDRICGGDGRDRILGGKGADILFGEGDGDKIYGDSGDDQLSGGTGNDLLVGGRGDDALDGDRGRRDRLRGRDGVDLCRDLQTQTRTSSCEGPGNASDLGPNHFRLESEDGTVVVEGRVHGVWSVPSTREELLRIDCLLVLLDATVVHLDGDITAPPRLYSPLDFMEVKSRNGFGSAFSEGCADPDAQPPGRWTDERAMLGVTSHLAYSIVLAADDELIDVRLRSGPASFVVFDTPLLTELPPVDQPGPSPDLPPLLDGATSTVHTRTDGLLTSTVQLSALGVSDYRAHIFDGRQGQCVTITGTIEHEPDPALFNADRPFAPRIGVLIDGTEYASNWPCPLPLDVPNVDPSFVTVDNVGPSEFGVTVFLPGHTIGDIDAIVVSQSFTGAAALYDPATLEPLGNR